MRPAPPALLAVLLLSACTSLPEAQFVRGDFTRGDVTYVAMAARDLPAEVQRLVRLETHDKVVGWHRGGDRIEVLTARRTDGWCGGAVYHYVKVGAGYAKDSSVPTLDWMCSRESG